MKSRCWNRGMVVRSGFYALGCVALLSSCAHDDDAANISRGRLPASYRDWRVVSVAHEAGELDDIRAIVGNNAAVAAFRANAPAPDGAILARLAWKYTPSEENNRAFGKEQSWVAGAPTNVQFMIRDSKKYAATGGWSFAQFNEGKPVVDAVLIKGCYDCHAKIKDRGFVFTRYAP